MAKTLNLRITVAEATNPQEIIDSLNESLRELVLDGAIDDTDDDGWCWNDRPLFLDWSEVSMLRGAISESYEGFNDPAQQALDALDQRLSDVQAHLTPPWKRG
jgi:hypothetical protein